MICYRLIITAILVSVISCSKKNDSITNGLSLTNLQNIQFGAAPDSGGITEALLMDIYFPAGSTTAKKYPLVVMIHGGAFVSGNKEDVSKHCQVLADSGFVAATISYRLGWRNGTGNCNGDTLTQRMAIYRAVQDANAALRYLVSKSGDYAIDVNHIFIGGASAGAVTSLTATYMNNVAAQQIAQTEYTTLGPVSTSGNTLTNVFTIKAVANLWGSLPDSNLINSSNAVPMISFHGTGDNIVPYDFGKMQNCSNYPMQFGSACLTRRLHAIAKPYILHLKTGAGHGPDLYTPAYTMSRVALFFKTIISGAPVTGKVWIE